eukprot:18242-Heterococcus_DN1.PRE.2
MMCSAGVNASRECSTGRSEDHSSSRQQYLSSRAKGACARQSDYHNKLAVTLLGDAVMVCSNERAKALTDSSISACSYQRLAQELHSKLAQLHRAAPKARPSPAVEFTGCEMPVPQLPAVLHGAVCSVGTHSRW